MTGNSQVTTNVYRVSFWVNENVLNLGFGNGCTALSIQQKTVNCTLKGEIISE